MEIDRRWWRAAIRNGEVTFFAGAGISAMPPSNLPLATGLIEQVLEPVLSPLALPYDIARSITQALVQLRPEVITDVLVEHIGIDAAKPLLHVLRGEPNAWHAFLADAQHHGCRVITTNFDTLIEQAGGSDLFKIHGSIGDGLTSIALAVRQVGRGLSLEQTERLRALVKTRPLIVIGYSGRDEFDIMPVLNSIERTAPGLWIVHEPEAPLRPVEWTPRFPVSVDVFAGETSELLAVLRPHRMFGRLHSAPDTTPRPEPWQPPQESAAIALIYSLVEAREFTLARQLFARMPHPSARLLVAYAVVLEKYASDLRDAACVAQQARRASRRASPDVRALVLDQSGVIARRRGLYRIALRYYDQALSVAATSKTPAWLVIQIRSHRAVALEYLGLRAEAVREHRRVAAWEKRTGDLRGYAKSLNNIGIAQMNQQQWKRAIAAFERSCALKRDLGDDRGIAQTLHNLGKLHFLRDEYALAEKAFLESLAIRLGRGRDEHGAAQSYVALAHVAQKAGRLEDAATYATRALEAHNRIGDSRGVAQARGILRAREITP
jgi:tetratricopeptide (TPR) repeat protein